MTKKASLYAAGAVLAWSTVASAFKITLRHIDPLLFLLYASIVSTGVFFFVLVFQQKLPLLKSCSKTDYGRSAMLGFLNPFLYYLVLFQAYSLLPAQEAQPLNWTWPIVLALLSVPLLKQKVTTSSLLALGISFLGVLVISTHGDLLRFRFTNLSGAILAVGSSIIWALFWIGNIRDHRDEITKLFLNFCFGTIFVLILVALTGTFALPGLEGFLGSAYAGFFEMGITFVIWMKALKLSRSTARIGNFIYATPFLSLVVIRFVAGEHIAPSSIIGLALIMAGITLQQRSHRGHITR